MMQTKGEIWIWSESDFITNTSNLGKNVSLGFWAFTKLQAQSIILQLLHAINGTVRTILIGQEKQDYIAYRKYDNRKERGIFNSMTEKSISMKVGMFIAV